MKISSADDEELGGHYTLAVYDEDSEVAPLCGGGGEGGGGGGGGGGYDEGEESGDICVCPYHEDDSCAVRVCKVLMFVIVLPFVLLWECLKVFTRGCEVCCEWTSRCLGVTCDFIEKCVTWVWSTFMTVVHALCDAPCRLFRDCMVGLWKHCLGPICHFVWEGVQAVGRGVSACCTCVWERALDPCFNLIGRCVAGTCRSVYSCLGAVWTHVFHPCFKALWTYCMTPLWMCAKEVASIMWAYIIHPIVQCFGVIALTIYEKILAPIGRGISAVAGAVWRVVTAPFR